MQLINLQELQYEYATAAQDLRDEHNPETSEELEFYDQATEFLADVIELIQRHPGADVRGAMCTTIECMGAQENPNQAAIDTAKTVYKEACTQALIP